MKLTQLVVALSLLSVSISAKASIFVTGSTSKLVGGKCNAIVNSIGTCYTPSDTFYFKIATINGVVEIDSKSTPPKGYELKYSTNKDGIVDGYILSYPYLQKSTVYVSRLASDGVKSSLGKKSFTCSL